jgi:hypothetical protein
MEIRGDRLQTARARKHVAAGEKQEYDEGFDKGFEQGLDRAFQEKYRKAVEQARSDDLAYLVTVQLQSRFGPLPPYAARAIAAADSTALFWLGQRIFLARSLDDLLPRPARSRARATAAGTQPRSRVRGAAEGRNGARSRGR